MDALAQYLKAQELVNSIDIGQRHAIVVEHNDKVTALSVAAILAVQNNQPDSVKLICETLFALGYMAGRDDDIDLGIFKGEVDENLNPD